MKSEERRSQSSATGAWRAAGNELTPADAAAAVNQKPGAKNGPRKRKRRPQKIAT